MPKSQSASPKSSHLGTPIDADSSSFQSAPTPYNTFVSSDSYGSQSISQLERKPSQETASDAMCEPYKGGNLLLPLPSETPSLPIHQISFSSHASSHLLPNPSLTMSQSSEIPFSSRSIPATPASVASEVSLPSGRPNGGPATPSSEHFKTALPPTVKFGTDLKDGGSREIASQEDVDAQRLQSLGYDAVLGRQYTFWSSLAINWLNMGALQGTIFAVAGTYSYGGPLMILIAWPLAGLMTFLLTLTMSELASAYPVAGAMFSWSWKAARGGVGGERGWAWLVSGFVLGGHIGSILLVTWEITNIVVGTISLSIDYNHRLWINFVLFIAVLLIVGAVGCTRWGQSHRFWLCAGAFGLCMWAVLCIALLATNATKYGPGAMLKQFYNTTGWNSKSYVYMLGWVYTCIASGADASAHMAEETQNPSRNVPNAMTASVVATYILAYIAIILLLFSISPEDATTAITHPFTFGFILTKAISQPGAIAICCLMIVVLVLQVLSLLQSSSRFVFALARENGMPFSSVIKRTNAHKRPVYAIWTVVILCIPFAGLTLTRRSMLYSVVGVTSCTLSYVGYSVPIGLYLFSKIDLQTEGRSLWSLRRWSKPVAVIGLLYALAVVIAQTLPGSTPVTADTMSWSPVIIVGTIMMCYVTWRCYGDRNFAGPIRAITKWESGVEIDLSTTLASSRSRSSNSQTLPSEGRGNSSLKLALSPYHPTVTVQSAQESGVGSDGLWTSASDSGGTVSEWTVTRTQSKSKDAGN
ncbi:hypothetical protein L204_100830 [Cryptococcus depauperatus]|nr:amino acid/metabolite permease [Cryptococcus depauperatus CBS 7855]